MRTDDHRNPTAFTTDIAHQAGLSLGIDYEIGQVFPGDSRFFTAKLLGDPVSLTIRVIDALGFYNKSGAGRWTYIAVPKFVWNALDANGKRDVIGFMYRHEGGVAMRALFPNYTVS